MPLGNRKIQRKRTGKSKSIPNPSIKLDDVAENNWGVEDDSPATTEAENNGGDRKSEPTQKQSIAPISKKKKAPTKKSGNISSSRSSNRDSSSEEEIVLSPDEELEEDSSHGPSPLVEHESDESSILLDESEQSEQQGSHQDDTVSKGAKSRSRLDEDDEEFELDEADEDQNEKKNAVARSRNGKSTSQRSNQESFDSDNDVDSFEDKPPPGRTRKGQRASLREVDSDEDFSDHDGATSNRRESDEDHVKEEEFEVAKARKTESTRQRSRNGQTSNTRASSLREEDSDEELDGHGKEENEAPRRQKRARATRNRRGSVQDFSTEDSDVEDHEEEKTVARSRKTESSRQASRIARKSKITKKAASLREEDSDEEFDIHDKEENEAPTRKHRARATRNGKRSVQYLGMDDSDDEEDHVEDEEVAKHNAKSPRRESRKTKASKTDERAVSEPRQRRTPKKQTQKVAYEDFGESDEADEQKEAGTKTRLNDSDDDFSPGGDDDSSHGDSGESFREVKKSKRKKPTVTKRKKAKTAKKAPKRRSKAAYSDESSDGEEQKRNRPPRRKTRRPPSDLAEFIAGSEEEEEDDADESDYEESMSTLGSRRSRRQTASRKNLKEYSSSEVEENLEAEEISSAAHVSGKRLNRRVAKGKAGSSANKEKRHSRAKKRKATTKKQKEEDSDDSESEDQGQAYSTPLSNRGRSPRQSASKAAKKVATLLEENNEDDDFQMNWKGGDKEEDEEFEIDSQGGDSDSSAEIADVDEDDESLVEKKENNAGLVDVDESFLDPDISSGDDNSEVVRTPPSLKIVKVKTPNRRKNDESSDDESVVGDVESDEEKSPASPFVCAHMPRCDSTSDAITMDALPTRHICFYMPDGKTKQCFALETLHKIALSGVVNYEDGKQTFKQPPHFRSAMEDDILDQIASRFGRDAVDPAGQFYNRKRLPPARTDGDSHSDAGSAYILNFDGNLANDDAFTEHLNKYLTNQMGSRDVYCCPVCYTEAHIRLETDGIEAVADEASDEEPEDVNLEFRSDPITVLGCVDEDKFVMASGFCFAKLVQVKEHLRKDHGVDPSTISGNDLYKRFQIRASDGLLQRYLDRRNGNRVSRQGQMMSYWYQGNNELFVYLLHLMDRCRLIRNEAEDHVGDDEEDEDVKGSLAFEENLQTFWSTFSNRGKRLWDFISQPYRKMTKGELKEFLADDVDIAESGDEVAYHMINRDMDAEPTPEDEIVAALRQSRGRDVEEESSSEDEEVSVEEEEWDENDAEEGAFDSSEEELAEIDGQYSEEEEEDEWVSKIKSKGKARAKRNRRKSNTKVVVVGQAKKLGGKKRRSSEPYSTPPMKSDSSSAAVAAVASSNKRRSILEDSESD